MEGQRPKGRSLKRWTSQICNLQDSPVNAALHRYQSHDPQQCGNNQEEKRRIFDQMHNPNPVSSALLPRKLSMFLTQIEVYLYLSTIQYL